MSEFLDIYENVTVTGSYQVNPNKKLWVYFLRKLYDCFR